jgi:hypothetical protein
MLAATPNRYSFLLKLAGASLLVALADLLFWFQNAGSTLGLFALAMLIVLGSLRTELFRRWPSRLAFAAALYFALALSFDRSVLALVLFWTAITLAALLPRAAGFDNGLRWAGRLIVHGLCSPFGPLRDVLLARQAKRRRGSIGVTRYALILVVPVAGSALFLFLFAQANPLIEQAFARIDLRLEASVETIFRAIFWGTIFLSAWSLLRPTRFALPATLGHLAPLGVPALGLAPLSASLLAFNAVFALQNGLDLAFLWSGAPLPEGMTLAEYAHRGAYPLIVTALLAGLFVLAALRPCSETASSRPVRLLVTLWIGQNLLLVASTMLRTFDYIHAYSLTRLRIAALLWMGLVAVGLVLICYRLLRGKSSAWLINANLLAALLVLAGCSFVDLGRMAAAWNVRHAREVGGAGAPIDLCYLRQLGPSALLPLLELETRPLPPRLRQRVRWARTQAMDDAREWQADWHGWTARDALRLARAEAIVAQHRLSRYEGPHRNCDGTIYVPPPEMTVPPAAEWPPAAPQPPKPLTARPAR